MSRLSILVTGATGFLGEHVLHKLVASRITPVCFVRPTSDLSLVKKLDLPVRYGTLEEVVSLEKGLDGVDVIVNLASLGFGHAPNIVRACQRAGVHRGVFISTTSVFTNLNAKSKSVRLAAEESIAGSAMAWTVLRPTMIYGTERDRNMARLVRFLSRSPLMPVLGQGKHLQQPIHVDDLADAVLSTIDQPAAYGRAYNVSGQQPLSLNEIIETTAEALGRKVLKVHFPVKPAVSLLQVYERIAPKPFLKTEQVMRLEEDKVFPHDEAARDFNFSPRSFRQGISEEVKRMRRVGLIR